MADIVRRQDNGVPASMQTRYRDMGDGTHALVTAGTNVQVGGADVSASNALPVNIADTDALNPVRIALNPTITAGAYAAGDALGGRLAFENVVPEAGGGGTITKVVIVDKDNERAPIDLVLFDQPFTATADNAPFDPTDADLEHCIGYIDVAATDYAAFNDNAVAAKTSGLRMPFDYDLAANTSRLFGQMVIREAHTYTAIDDILIILTVRRR